MKKAISLCFALGFIAIAFGQDSLLEKTMEEVTVAANKWQQNINEVPNKITKISKTQILHNNPQTAADLLSQSGTVFVQKSQLGGGSPMIRGFSTNRVLIVVDGVRMNNAIYRSGNLQNVISIDPLNIENAEIIFGPGSLIYGSDAIGGVMDFHTLQPLFSTGKKWLITGSALIRYSTANKEKTAHADINLGGKKLSFLGSYTFSDFDDLKMGKNGPQENYLRPEYVQRINDIDSILKNAAPRIQRFSGYDQTNFLGKMRYKINDNVDLQYHFTYARTGNAPRYDRLIQYRNGQLRFAEWNYGPMLWRMHNVRAAITKKMAMADDISIIAGYQDYKESRIDRARASNNRTEQSEGVEAYNINADVAKKIGKGILFYGLEYVYNKVESIGSRSNISTRIITPFNSRYPDGSIWSTAGFYGSYKINFNPKLTFTTGLRYSYNTLVATFDTTFIKFPYKKAALNHGALTGNAGLVFRPLETWQLNGNISTGYRSPNVDDIGKLFESTPGNITFPNPNLKPEYAWNFEIGIVKNTFNKIRIELSAFHTILNDAIVRRPFSFNGQDSIDFDGTKSRVEALQNAAKATVWGLQSGVRVYFSSNFYVQTNANFVSGKETDDVKAEQVPLRHAPPFYGSTHLHYQKKNLHVEAYTFYNSRVTYKKLAPTEQAKPDIYSKDEQGLPYSPEWYTVNIKTSYSLAKQFLLSAGWENITNQRYRPYSSGIVATGSNLIVSVRASL